MTPSALAVVAGSFAVPSPAQQLLDRLLAGYARDGAFQPRSHSTIRLFAPDAPPAELERRARDFALQACPDLDSAVVDANAALVVWAGPGHAADAALLAGVLRRLRPGARCFVHGILGRTDAETHAALALARERDVHITAATSLATTFRLPEIHPRPGHRIAEALIVVQGPNEDALLDGVEGLLPDLDRAGVDFFESGLVRIEAFRDDAVWRAQQDRVWPGDLLAAALSRTNNPQGDPVADGRTQDLYGLGLVPRLARDPRAWVTHHPDGCRTTILALDGVVTDINLAWRTRGGNVGSTQLYRPPAPGRGAFDTLAAVIDDYFQGRPLPWSKDRARHAANWLAALRQ